MFRKIKITDIIIYIVAVIGVIYSGGQKTEMDIVFSVLLAIVIGIIMARILYIETDFIIRIRVFIRAILQIMAISTVCIIIFGNHYIMNLIISAVCWATYLNADIVNQKQQEEGKRRADAWRYYEYRKRARDNRTSDYTKNTYSSGTSSTRLTPFQKSKYYKDCTNEEELKDKYRDLVKLYHPDNNGGNAELFVQINNEYEELLEYVEGTNG